MRIIKRSIANWYVHPQRSIDLMARRIALRLLRIHRVFEVGHTPRMLLRFRNGFLWIIDGVEFELQCKHGFYDLSAMIIIINESPKMRS